LHCFDLRFSHAAIFAPSDDRFATAKTFKTLFGLFVIASEAKQSISLHGDGWIASSLRSLAQTLRVCRRQ
jgi:hypothetical protein